MKKTLFLSIFVTLLAFSVNAQDRSTGDTSAIIQPAKPRSSPMAITFYKKDDIYIKIVYSQPLRRGRQIFGSLVPFGKVWRTGANEATELTTTRDIRLGGKNLKAGTYTLFSIPEKDKWTIIVNTDLGQWGEYKYDAAKDLFRFEVPVQTNPKEIHEAFTIKFAETATGADIVLNWDDTKVIVPATFGGTNNAVPSGNSVKKKKSK
jgi:hypothetical protein